MTWGDAFSGGDSSSVDVSSNVQTIFSTSRAFAALKTDGSVVTWGSGSSGGDSSGVDLSSDVTKIIALGSIFLAFKSNKKVIIWGEFSSEFKNTMSFKNHFTGLIEKVYQNDDTIFILKKDNSLYSIGTFRSIAPDLRGAN